MLQKIGQEPLGHSNKKAANTNTLIKKALMKGIYTQILMIKLSQHCLPLMKSKIKHASCDPPKSKQLQAECRAAQAPTPGIWLLGG